MRNSRASNRRGRIAALVAVCAVAVTVFASLGGVGLAQNAIGLHQYQYGKKVTICHKLKKTVRISLRAWLAHKRHGDSIGVCDRKAWKKHRKHEQHRKHEKHWKKDKGADSRELKKQRGERVGRGQGHGNGNGNKHGNEDGKGNNKR